MCFQNPLAQGLNPSHASQNDIPQGMNKTD
jgi:hypothetical protein